MCAIPRPPDSRSRFSRWRPILLLETLGLTFIIRVKGGVKVAVEGQWSKLNRLRFLAIVHAASRAGAVLPQRPSSRLAHYEPRP